MNFVYWPGTLTPLNPAQLANAANSICPLKIYRESDFRGESNRVQRLRCDCRGNGEFELILPFPDEFRYIARCRICGKEMRL